MDLRFIEQIDVSSRFTPAFIVVQTFTGEWEAMLTDLRFEKKLRIRRWTMIYRLGIKLRIPVDAGEIVALPGLKEEKEEGEKRVFRRWTSQEDKLWSGKRTKETGKRFVL
ncbi:hypothetical protein HZH66_002812 [Vespula vulgaris]|uniref:Uncharacterized protein n=1 Tax=Vespula vulgaris TaxID=7454 RepID=A0A834NGK6_VESVU|nr:hypothetical protein HZH66_002812 [Vespula vulgaris]